MKFRDFFDVKQIIFAVVIIVIMMFLAAYQSNNVVKVSFADTQVRVTSNKYILTIDYDEIASVSLETLVEPGEKVEDGYDDNVIRAGKWKNDSWGEYYICADPDTSNCIVVTLDDGRVLVFSRKNDKETSEIYAELLTYLGKTPAAQ